MKHFIKSYFVNRPLWVCLLAILVTAHLGCNKNETQFKQLPASYTHINFNNKIVENDSINPIDMEFLYNGGGVATADFNNDGREDIFFTAGMTSCKLYLNKGKMQFEDVTAIAKAEGKNRWINGVSVIDINNDGLKDIYLCASIKADSNDRKNILYINKGIDQNGNPSFEDMAAEYGLDEAGFSVQAAWLDYDNDGDLDVYIANTKLTSRGTYSFGAKPDSSKTDFDKLLQNNFDTQLNHPVFTEVSEKAGINGKGFGLGVSVSDINKDGRPDIYVTNDFFTSDHFWINNGNGTFSNEINTYTKHTSQNAMGNCIADFNNDGWADVMEVDMYPEDNFRKQKNMSATNYARYRNMVDKGFSVQQVRNTLQLNLGPTGDTGKRSIAFADIGYYAGVDASDWSWSPLLADFDNDGLKDLLITNGYPKDVTDHDYISYRRDNGYIVPRKDLLAQIPEIKIENYAYKNIGNLQFEQVAKKWGLNNLDYSTGAAYADLDNDGDLDYITNNINCEASIFENKLKGKNFVQLQFKGDEQNLDGIGAKVYVWTKGKMQFYEHYPWTGYLSTSTFIPLLGIDTAKIIDSIMVEWKNGKTNRLNNLKVNQKIVLDINNAKSTLQPTKDKLPTFFTNSTTAAGINFLHRENDYVDFDFQRLLPRKLSDNGPAIAVGDVDGDKLEDFYVSGSKGFSGGIFHQKPNGQFDFKELHIAEKPNQINWEETDCILFDADNDGDLDLYTTSGGSEWQPDDSAYLDKFYINDGKGNFKWEATATPQLTTSKSCVKQIDFDGDGLMDLFIGGKNIPNQYPKPANSYLLKNTTKNGVVQFVDVTKNVCPALTEIGMVTDAVFADIDSDNIPELVLCGTFMPIKVFNNINGVYKEISTNLTQQLGMWNCISSADIDNDGDQDLVVGNWGLNGFYKGTVDKPFEIYANDFDKNGSYDALPFLYLKNSNGSFAQYPSFNRDDMIKQMIRIKRDFQTYTAFGNATLQQILKPEEMKSALKVSANEFRSMVFINNGKGNFTANPLPPTAQLSTINCIKLIDVNNDENLDIVATTNDYGMETNCGQYDALNSLVLLGNGKGAFENMPYQRSGLFLPGYGKDIANIKRKNNNTIIISRSKGQLALFDY